MHPDSVLPVHIHVVAEVMTDCFGPAYIAEDGVTIFGFKRSGIPGDWENITMQQWADYVMEITAAKVESQTEANQLVKGPKPGKLILPN